jgi:pimeloyl-ACP methyl ester carboxylesterase
MKEIVHFAHANGFPSACYQQLFSGLRSDYDVITIPMIGHDPTFPVTENWTYLVDELIESIVSQTKEPVIGIGHSLGGVLTALASFKRPELFSKIILLDAPIFSFNKSTLIRLIKKMRLIHLVTPSKKTKNRMVSWRSRDELKQYLLSKPLYRNFNQECLADYIEHGMVKSLEGEYRLKFDRIIESEIYQTIPHNMYRLMMNHEVPISLVYSTSSHIVTNYDLRKMSGKYKINVFPCLGGHLFPLEYPKDAACCIRNILAKD